MSVQHKRNLWETPMQGKGWQQNYVMWDLSECSWPWIDSLHLRSLWFFQYIHWIGRDSELQQYLMHGRSYNYLKGLSLDLHRSCHFHFEGHFQTSSLHLNAKHVDRCIDKSHSGLLSVYLGIRLAVAVYTLIFYCLQN